MKIIFALNPKGVDINGQSYACLYYNKRFQRYTIINHLEYWKLIKNKNKIKLWNNFLRNHLFMRKIFKVFQILI